MSDYLVLTEFIPGTKAKAQEINANFTTIKDAINTKAAINGDSTKTFNVASATSPTNAVTKAQMDTSIESLSDDFINKFNKIYIKFCAKSGNVTNGNADLFSYSSLAVTAKVGGSYPNLVISNYKGENTTITSMTVLSLVGKADGTYNVFAKSDSTLYVLANKIYKQPDRPTMVEGDVWLNTSIQPIKAIKYTSGSDEEFLDVPLGKVVITNSAITTLTTFPYNQNGYDINTLSEAVTYTNSFAANGYTKLPNGLTLQWGTITPSSGTNLVTITFPLAFPNACFWADRVNNTSNGATSVNWVDAIVSKSATQMTFYSDVNFLGNAQWFALGY